MWSFLRREVNAVKPISATSASEIQQEPSSSRVRIADRGPSVLADRGDRLLDRGVHPGGDREPGSAAAGGGDDVVAVERRVAADEHQTVAIRAARAAGPGGAQRLAQQLARAAGGLDRTLAQP